MILSSEPFFYRSSPFSLDWYIKIRTQLVFRKANAQTIRIKITTIKVSGSMALFNLCYILNILPIFHRYKGTLCFMSSKMNL
jgi:hypothetical protein